MPKKTDIGILILRVTLGALMLLHGLAKLSKGVDGIESNLLEHGMPGFIAYGVYIGELIAPLLLIIGFRTKIAAMIFAFNMFVAVLLAHAADIFTLGKSGGWAVELIALYFFGSVVLVFTGGGMYSVSATHKWD